MNLYQLWKGSSDLNIIHNLSLWLQGVIPEDIRINMLIDENKILIMGRDLADYISKTIRKHNHSIIEKGESSDGTSGVGVLEYVGNLDDMEITIVLRTMTNYVFPYKFFSKVGMNIELSPGDIEELVIIINTSLDIITQVSYEETWESKKLVMRYKNKDVFINDFEKGSLGSFFYLLYLRDRFKYDQNVCVIVSDLDPLFSRAKEIEAGLIKLKPEEFKEKYKSYDYNDLYVRFHSKSTQDFRLYLLRYVVRVSTPYITGEQLSSGTVKVNISNTFKSLFDRCIKTNASKIVTFVMMFSGNSGHANMLIIDKNERVVERFEPNGYSMTENKKYKQVITELDKVLTTFFSELGYNYIPPQDFCPYYGIQLIENIFSHNVGFCVTWSVIYSIERLESKVSREFLSKNFLGDIITKYQLKGKTEEETIKNIEDWINEFISTVFSSLQIYYDKLSEILGINISYKNKEGTSCLILSEGR